MFLNINYQSCRGLYRLESVTRRLGLVIMLLLVASAGRAAAADVPAACSAMVTPIGVPVAPKREHTILCRLGYVLSHDSEYLTPNWVVEHLTPARFSGEGDREAQGNPFAADPTLEQDGAEHAELADYRARFQTRAFDRGHMAPAGEMKFSVEAMEQSFYLSNMAPQQGNGMNRHIWADLESLVRDWVCDRGELYVITGPIYDKDQPDMLNDHVAIPTAFFKIAYDPGTQHAISFILPNEKVDKHGKKPWEALKAYIVPVQEVADRSGLQLFRGLSKRKQNQLLGLKSVMWKVDQGCKP